MPKYVDIEKVSNDKLFEGLTSKEKAKLLQWIMKLPDATDVTKVTKCKHCGWYLNISMRCGNPFGVSSCRMYPEDFCSRGGSGSVLL